ILDKHVYLKYSLHVCYWQEMKVVIPGGSGQVGNVLTRALRARGDDVVVLSTAEFSWAEARAQVSGPRQCSASLALPPQTLSERGTGAYTDIREDAARGRKPRISPTELRCRGETNGARRVVWDGRSIGAWADEIDGADVVINLAGRTVNCRYTE